MISTPSEVTMSTRLLVFVSTNKTPWMSWRSHNNTLNFHHPIFDSNRNFCLFLLTLKGAEFLLLRESSLIYPDEFVMYTNCPFGCTIQIPQRSSDNNVNYFRSKFLMVSKLELFARVFWKPFKHFFIFVDSMKPPTFVGSFHFKVRHI